MKTKIFLTLIILTSSTFANICNEENKDYNATQCKYIIGETKQEINRLTKLEKEFQYILVPIKLNFPKPLPRPNEQRIEMKNITTLPYGG